MRARCEYVEHASAWAVRGTDGRQVLVRDRSRPLLLVDHEEAYQVARRINDTQARRLERLAQERAQALAARDTAGVLRAGIAWERAR